ncbi:hypothetical protein TeGR_g6828 [Tetraparma gracilis]|uniref:Large ribosomal subunit protein eL24-related N-terminal domain-containing protein n=1 Tax=Tetraparma gracilis TaxID=2962635 RepID=A0ABQ6NCE8_9STRA|nr:hypothetical protein TeGR_g6828 [Tetraparma gracilis]
MVIKTELCAFSQYRIYPGNGMTLIKRDGREVILGSAKAKSMLVQRKKPAKLVWTQAWRRANKKGLSETLVKKRTRKVNKIQRAVVGASVEDIKKKAAQNTAFRSAQRDAAMKEVKEKKKAAAAERKKAGKGASQQKAIKQHNGGKRGKTQR